MEYSLGNVPKLSYYILVTKNYSLIINFNAFTALKNSISSLNNFEYIYNKYIFVLLMITDI